MDISTATTLASGIVGLIVPAVVQAFKKYIRRACLFGRIHPVRHHRHRRHRRIRRHPHMGNHARRNSGRRPDRVHAR